MNTTKQCLYREGRGLSLQFETGQTGRELVFNRFVSSLMSETEKPRVRDTT